METGGTLVSSSPVMASVGAGFQDETSRTNTTGGSTAKVSKARMKASAGTARQRKEPQTVIGTSTFSEENNKHQQSLAEGTMETIAASVNNNNNVECDSVNEGEATMDKQNKDTKNPSGHSDNDRKQQVDAVGEELCNSKDGECFSTTKIASDESKTLPKTEEEDDEDNWESLIDNGTLDKSLESLHIKGSARLNELNKELQKDQQKKEKAKGPMKVNVHLEDPSRGSTPPTFKILRREVAPAGGHCAPSAAVNGEMKRHLEGDANGQTAGTRRITGHNGVPTPPAGKSFAQRQEEYARARMRILGCPGNGPSAAATPAAQPRNHNGPQATQKPMCGNVGRGFGPDTTGRRGSYPGGPHRRHNPATQSSGYLYGNSSTHQHHQNNNTYSNNAYYGGNRALHGPLSNGSFQGTGATQHSPAATIHRTNGGTYGR